MIWHITHWLFCRFYNVYRDWSNKKIIINFIWKMSSLLVFVWGVDSIDCWSLIEVHGVYEWIWWLIGCVNNSWDGCVYYRCSLICMSVCLISLQQLDRYRGYLKYWLKINTRANSFFSYIILHLHINPCKSGKLMTIFWICIFAIFRLSLIGCFFINHFINDTQVAIPYITFWDSCDVINWNSYVLRGFWRFVVYVFFHM